jgi:kynureninase
MTERVIDAEPARLDAADGLAPLRQRFHLPLGPDGSPAVYLCGNSLGPMPVDAAARVREVLDLWSTLAVRGHHVGPDPWIHYHEAFAAPLARLVGASPAEVVAMNTLTVNLHLLLVSFYQPVAGRYRILLEQGAFPSDRYAFDSQVRFHGHRPEDALIEVAPRAGEDLLRTEDLVAAIETAGNSLALVLLPGVQYRTGQVLDVTEITRVARHHGAAVGWDLAHSIGNVPVALHDSGADFAVWCSYKYLCGGPGAVGGAFVHERHARNTRLPRFAGWWGHDASTRFEMGPAFSPMVGAEGWQLSNPPVLSLAPLKAALELFETATLPALRVKSAALTAFARRRISALIPAGRVTIVTPSTEADSGCQLSLRITGSTGAGRRVFAALTERGIIGDWREPDIVRLAPAPLYNSYAEVAHAIRTLATAVELHA